jgi:molybdopterin converting factor small subunit
MIPINQQKFPYYERVPIHGVMTFTIHWLVGQNIEVSRMVSQLATTLMIGEEIRILPPSTGG